MVWPLIAAAAVGAVAGGVSAYMDAKAQKKAIKAQRDADLSVLQVNTKAELASLKADAEANEKVIYTNALAQLQAKRYEYDTEGENIGIARLMARDALNRGVFDEVVYRREASQEQGTQRAEFASTGVDIGSGSAAFLQEEMAVATDLDGLAIRQNAGREAYGHDVEAYAGERKRGLIEMEGKSTADVANANIEGLRKTAAIRASGISESADVRMKAIRKVAETGLNATHPYLNAALGMAGHSSNFASAYYMYNDTGSPQQK